MLCLQHPLLLFATLLATAAAQPNFTTLIKSRSELTNLSTYFDLHPDIVQLVLEWPNGTFLAPSDKAFANNAPVNDAFKIPLNITDAKETGIAALFKYHMLAPFLRSADFSNGPHILPTTLFDPAYTSLPAGQVVVANGIQGHQPSLTSGLQSVSNIVVPDLEHEGGIVHIVDKFLAIPPSVLKVLAPLGLTAAEGALTKATNLGSELQKTNLPLFIPENAAFKAVGSLFSSVSETQLRNILGYHVVPAAVKYLGPESPVSLPTLISEDLHVVSEDGRVFINSAEAIVHNVLVAEGVIHIIDNVLNPNNTTAVPDYTAASQAPAFSGTTLVSGGSVPFTSSLSVALPGKGLSTGAKARIGIGVAIGVVIVMATVVFGVLRWKRSPYLSPARKVGVEHALKVVEVMPMKNIGGKPRVDEQMADSEPDERQDPGRTKDES